ncbi:MAG: MFS transporter [Promethearchaeota archaeon]
MSDRLARFFGVQDQPKRVKSLVRKSALFNPLFAVTFMMSSTFLAVHIAEVLAGPAYYLTLGLALVGNLAFVQSIVQLVLDYPTGGLGDWVGQRWILLTAFLCIGAASIYTAFATTLLEFLFIYVLQGIGFAQLSGAFGAWWDTNYRAVADDPDRSVYSVIMGKVGMIFQIASTLSLIPGAILADLISRQGVFVLQGGLALFLGFACLALLRDYPEVAENRPRRSLREYYGVLRDGLKYSVSSKFVFFFLIGTVLAMSTISVWANLILFGIYYSFLYEDKAVALFRTLLYIVGIISLERAGVWTRKLNPARWIAFFAFLQSGGAVFYFAFAFITATLPSLLVNGVAVPFPWMFFQLPALIVCLTFVFTGIFDGALSVLQQRLVLDLIPDRSRNSLYSLFPTLTLIFAAPQLIFFSGILPIFGPSPILIGLSLISTSGCLLIALGMYFRPKTKKLEEPVKEEALTPETDSTQAELEPAPEGLGEPPPEEALEPPEERTSEVKDNK